MYFKESLEVRDNEGRLYLIDSKMRVNPFKIITDNMELNDLRINIFFRKSEVIVKKFQFVLSMKIWPSMT